METIITAYYENILEKRIRDALALFKENDIAVINMSFDYSDSPFKCKIKTRGKE